MTDNTQPEAGSTHIIRYALEMGLLWIAGDGRDKVREALDALDTLETQLEAIGAGGVSPLIGQPQAMPDLSALTERGAVAWAGVDAQGLREGFTAADMATASAQGFRDGVASLAASAGEPQDLRQTLATTFRGLSDRAYCDYIEQMRRDVCLGWEYKAKHGKFGEAELKGHTKAAELLGRHRAFSEASNALQGSSATIAAPPTAQAGGWTKASKQLPPCREDQLYIGINTAGFAGVFNAVRVVNGNTYCLMEVAEESVSIMSDLAIWKPFNPPTSAEGVGHV